eukprot:scaffold17959_cov76-Phaeocystis_antarctica.AAC.1
MIFSFLIASVSTEPYKTGPSPSPSAIKNYCKEDGVVPNSYMVKLNTQTSDLSHGPSKAPLSFLKGWVQQYNPVENTKKGRKLGAGSNSTHAVHYFIQTQLAVAVETGDDVRHAQHTRPCRASGPPGRSYAHGPTHHRTRSPCAWPTTRPSPRLSMTATAVRTRTSRCSRTTPPRRARMTPRRACTRWAAS